MENGDKEKRMEMSVGNLDAALREAGIDPRLTKRARYALRKAYENKGSTSMPRSTIVQLEKRGLVYRDLYEVEVTEWQKTVKRLPVGVLTPLGEIMAEALVRIYAQLR